MTATIRDPRIGIFIVTYNAVTTLARVLDRIPAPVRDMVAEVFVFDDASQDDTYLVARGYQDVHRWANLTIVKNQVNQGYGGNQKLGYRYAVNRGLDYVVLLHGDGQYAPEELPRMLEPLLDGSADAVFGSRMMIPGAARKGGMPLYKLLGNRILTYWQNLLTERRLTEWHSGYRAYRVAALAELPLHLNSNDFHFDTEIILELIDRGYRIKEVPIPVYYGDEICYVNGLRYAKDVTVATVHHWLHRVGIRTDPRFSAVSRYPRKCGPYSSHSQIAAAIPFGSRVLDVGCEPEVAAGYLERKCTVVGVGESTNSDTAALEAFYVRDLEEGLQLPASEGRFDVIVLADIIEHLRNGGALLAEAKQHLRPGGHMILSTGNVAFVLTRLGLLFGRFNYSPRGILDETHVRLYTLRTFLATIRSTGLVPISVGVTPPPLEALFPKWSSSAPMRLLDWCLYSLARVWKRLFGFQFIVISMPSVTDAGQTTATPMASETYSGPSRAERSATASRYI